MISSIQTNLGKVLAHLSSLGSVQLVAVSKLKSVSEILEAHEGGQRHFGENYVGELVGKVPQLPMDIQWHFIGHLQSNKVKRLIVGCPNLFMIESVDSVKLANKLESVLRDLDRRVKVLVEVHTSKEDTKSGISVSFVPDLIHHIKTSCPHLEFEGLMTIANPSDPEDSFRQMFALKQSLNLQSCTMSMGMSGDYELAIEHGSTQVRIGSSIFGVR